VTLAERPDLIVRPKPTPGPWGVILSARIPNVTVWGPEGQGICDIRFDLKGGDMTEGLQNAELIAQAPTFRSRIEKLAEEWDKQADWENPDFACPWCHEYPCGDFYASRLRECLEGK